MSRSQDVLTEAAKATELSKEEYHTVVAAKRRRLALDSLAERTVPVELETLAAEIATKEEGVNTIDDDTISRVATSLHHAHLPKLENVGILEYNPESNQIEALDSWLQYEDCHSAGNQQ